MLLGTISNSEGATDAVTVLELAWLAALTWPWTRLVVDGRRRLARTTPWHHAAVVTVLVLAGVAAIALAVQAPVALHVATAAATLLAAAAWWRARPSYGRSRRLPPGSLAVTRSIEAMVDREFYAREARRHGPIFKMQFHCPVACVVGLERGHELMRLHRESLGTTPLPWNRELRGGFLRYMDEATHEVYGPLFRIALAGRAVAAAEPATRRAARRELAALAAACADSPAAGVPPGPALDRIVLVAFAHVLFGIDEESPDFARLEVRNVDLRAQILSTSLSSRSRAALDELRALVERRRRELQDAGDDGPVCTLSELGRVAPGMPDGVCIDNLLFLLKIPAGDVRSLLRWLVKMLGDHPDWRDRLRADLEAGRASAPSVADRIVMETLRLEQSEYIHRRVREDFEHDGFVFPAGWLLRLCVRESHRSEEVWSDAASFDPDRFLRQPVPKSQYSPFGFLQRACSGVDLSNMICRVTLEELAAFDWAIAADGELERDFGHWSHWRPNSRLRIRLEHPARRSAGPHEVPAQVALPRRRRPRGGCDRRSGAAPTDRCSPLAAARGRRRRRCPRLRDVGLPDRHRASTSEPSETLGRRDDALLEERDLLAAGCARRRAAGAARACRAWAPGR